MLNDALESIGRQTMIPTEVLVGDDDPEASGKAVAEAFAERSGLTVRYFHNKPHLGQAGNVGFLIEKARAGKVCLLHDDDWLMPEALADMSQCFEAYPSVVAVYGQQLISTAEGEIDSKASDALNRSYHRKETDAGLQSDAILAAVIQQFPNDGWLVHTDSAKRINYAKLGTEYRDAVDFVFGVELAKLRSGSFYFLNKPTTVYRLSDSSIARGGVNNAAYSAYCYVAAQKDVDTSHPDVMDWLRQRSAGAIVQALEMGKRKDAWDLYWSKPHRGRILSAGGLKRLLILFSPSMLKHRSICVSKS